MLRMFLSIVVILAAGMVAPAHAGKRLALIIGNSAYSEGPLKNPARDAELMAKTLGDVGFDVMTEIDADERAMGRAVVKFARKVEEAGKDAVALFYYAGHGVQYRGENFLIPVGARIEDEVDIDLEAVRAGTLLRQLEQAGARLNIVILDACRNNPFQSATRSLDRGLAKMDAPNGTLLAYSTAPGRVASDGTGQNSPYTQALSRAIKSPGLPIEQVFKRVRISVMERTNEDQVPWESSSLTGEFSFVEAAQQVAAVPADQTVEIEYWKSISQMSDPAAFQGYLDRYPGGLFADLAQQKVASLTAAPRSTVDQGDLIFYQSIQQSDDIASFEAYLERYPNGQFADIAKARISSLQQRAADRQLRAEMEAERQLWDGIQGSTDPALFETFLAKHPDGIFADLARARLAGLNNSAGSSQDTRSAASGQEEIAFWNSIRNSQDKSDYKLYLDRYPDGTFASIAQNRFENGYAPQIAALNATPAHPYDGDKFFAKILRGSTGPWQQGFSSIGEAVETVVTVRGGKFKGSLTSDRSNNLDIDLNIAEGGQFSMKYKSVGWRGRPTLRGEFEPTGFEGEKSGIFDTILFSFERLN